MSRDLLVTPHTPVLRAGHTRRTYGVLRALAAHRDVDLLYVRFDAEGPDAAFSAVPSVRMHEVAPSRGTRRLAQYAACRLSGVPAGIARGVSPELRAQAARLAQLPDRGRVIADGPISAAALMTLAGRMPVIYNAHNLESGFRHELASERGRDADRLRMFEAQVLSRFAESWMVSEADMETARSLCPSATLRYAPNVVDVSAITPVPRDQRSRRAIFVASFFYEPNRTGLRFLLEQVMPRVWSQMPDAELQIVGPGLDHTPSEKRVQALGFVTDLDAAYARAACAVVPLLQGGGTPLKLIEALAYGLPVIATPRAAAGLALNAGEHYLPGDGAEQFASSMLSALAGQALELGDRGRHAAQQRYSIEALTELLAPA